MTNRRFRVQHVWHRAVRGAVAPIRALVSRQKRVAAVAEGLLSRFPTLQDALVGLVRGDPDERYSAWVAKYDTLTPEDLAAMCGEQSKLTLPLLSLIVPVTGEGESVVEGLIDSLVGQIYERWEATCAGASEEGKVVTRVASSDERIRFLDSSSSAETCNEALRAAAGEFVVLLDPRVVLRPHTLFVLARTVGRERDAVVVYGDDDVLAEGGARRDHNFKPDWNESLFRAQNYLGGVVCVRRSRALAVGGFEDELDGDLAWGLLLRLTAEVPREAIHHIPHVLSHRRSSARHPRAASAHRRRLAALGEDAHVEPAGLASLRVSYALPNELPRVSVIVPSTCKPEILRPCIDGLLERTDYAPTEVLVVANGLREDDPRERDYLGALEGREGVRVLYDERPYNFSELNNRATKQATGSLLCFLNDDTQVIAPGWLSALVSEVLRDRVAAAGALLLYENGRIQHAGIVLGAGGVAAHSYRGRPGGTSGYHDRALVSQDISCVTAACMLVRRDAFEEVGGFDPRLAISYNDVDLCLRLRNAGWRIIWTPRSELYHRESASLGRHYAGATGPQWQAEYELVQSEWGRELRSDPHYNPNLSLDAFALWEPAIPPRVVNPYRASPGPATEQV